MTDPQTSKVVLETKSLYDPIGAILPSYMRNVNSILQARQQLAKISWEKEGNKVTYFIIFFINYYHQLINKDKTFLTNEEKRVIKLLILKGVPESKRMELWLITSGARREMRNNPGYYQFLVNSYPTDIELPNDRQIDLDIKRTFPEDPFFSDEVILKKLRNVLLAYSRRNISIGYVQGFNFIVGRLLKISQNEEEVFWIFTQMIESILPLNFYSEMAGLMIDVDILLQLLGKYFPDLIVFLDQNFFLDFFKNIMFQWFVSLFVSNFTLEASLLIWDVLMLEKNVVLFKVTIGIVRYILNDLIKIESLENFKNFIRNTFSNFNDLSYLKYYLLLRKYEFNLDILDRNRLSREFPVVDYICQMNTNKYKKLKEKISFVKDDCFEDWPICIYDSESVYKVHNHFVLKIGAPFTFIDDYFQIKFKSKEKKGFKNKNDLLLTFENALVERKVHLCRREKRRRRHKVSSGITTVLEQLNDMEDSLNILNLSTGDKSADVSIDRSTENEDSSNVALIDKKFKIHLDTPYEIKKKNYKKFKKQTKCLSLVSYSQFVRAHKEEHDFQAFISKLNNKYNKLAGKSFCLKNLDLDAKNSFSNDLSFDL